MISPSQSVNRNFSPRRGLPMNPDGVRHAERLKRIKIPAETATIAVSKDDPSVKCIRRSAILAEPTRWFPFNPVAINPCTAGIAINLDDNSIKKYSNPLYLNTGGFLYHRNNMFGFIRTGRHVAVVIGEHTTGRPFKEGLNTLSQDIILSA